MSINERKICEDIVTLHDNIIAAGVIRNQSLVTRFSRIPDPPVTDERLRILFAQPDIIIGICRNNEEFFGNLRYLIICFESSDLVFFPAYVEHEEEILFIRMKRSYRGEEILQKVYEYLERNEK